jgi:hypothetical protein
MNTTTFPTRAEYAPVNRLPARGGWLALSSQDVTHLLLLLDPLHVAEDALAFALDFTRDRWPHVTIMHGGRLVRSLAADIQAARHEDKDALFGLICLYWQIKSRYENVTISHRVPHSAQQVLAEVSESFVDLIMLPESLFAPFKHLVTVDGGQEVLRSSPCPIVVITAAAIDSTEAPISDISWFR